MRDSLRELYAEMDQQIAESRDEAELGSFTRSREHLRRVMSAASKLHTRLTILAEDEDTARYVAEVDRALKRKPPALTGSIEGDQPLPFPPHTAAASRRKPRGKGKG